MLAKDPAPISLKLLVESLTTSHLGQLNCTMGMKLKFWGTCGSLPAPIEGAAVRNKIFRALQMAAGKRLESDSAILRFIDEELPFEVSQTYGGNTSCVEIALPDSDTVFLLDGGSGLREYSEHYIASGKANTKRTFHIFMSHLHWDHIQGFPFFTPAFLPGNKVIVHSMHPEAEEIFTYQMKGPWFPVTVDSMKSTIEFCPHQPGDTLEIEGLSISTREQMHPGKSCGYRFEFDDSVFVYSTDSEHNEKAYSDDYDYLEFIREADLLVFDAQYNLHDATFNKVNWGHSSNIMGVELASRAKVKHLVIFHHEPSNSDEDLSEFLFSTRSYCDIYYSETDPGKEKVRYPEKISLAFDGMKLEV